MEKPPMKVLPDRNTGSACIRHQTKEKRNLHAHTRAHLQETSHMPIHSPTGQIPLRESQTHQNQWSHSCSLPKAKMEMDHVGSSNHLKAGGPRVKVRWSLGSRPKQGATDLRTYTELEHEPQKPHRQMPLAWMEEGNGTAAVSSMFASMYFWGGCGEGWDLEDAAVVTSVM